MLAVTGAQLADRCADGVADGAAKAAAGISHGSLLVVSGYDTAMRWLCVLLVLIVETAGAQYPAKSVRLVVGFAPGGGTDIIARLLAQKLGERWGQAVVVDNRLGASGNIAAELVAKSAPDGYTLLMAFSSHASNAALSKLPFDINRDFSSISLVGS